MNQHACLSASPIRPRLRALTFFLLSLTLAIAWPGGALGQTALRNGDNHPGAIVVIGEVDSWSFTAAKGDRLTVSIGEVFEGEVDPGFYPRIRLIRPDGVQVGADSDYLAAQVTVTAPLSGTYVVRVDDNSGQDRTGSYLLRLAQTPGEFVVPAGDEGGAMTNGANHPGKITLGDLDLWSFVARQGDNLTISIGEVFEGEVDPGFYPRIQLIRPDGVQVGADSDYLAAQVIVTAPLSGTYVVLVDDNSGQDRTGSYLLRLAQTPGDFVVPAGDEGGAMTNGANHPGKITLGDLDLWSFVARQGDNLTISIGEVFEGELDPGFYPRIRLVRPDGVQVGADSDYLAALVTVTAPLSGTYVVLVDDNSGQDRTGSYLLRLAQTPGEFVVPAGDEGGAMTNGANHPGRITLGDVDLWSFVANQGDSLTVSIGEVFVGELDPGFYPRIRLLRPDGVQVGADADYLAALVTVTAPLSGTYVVLVDDNSGQDRTGSYVLHLAVAPERFVVSAGDQGGLLSIGSPHAGFLHLGDLDLWYLRTHAGETVSIRVRDTSDGGKLYPQIRIHRPDGSLVESRSGPEQAEITFRPTDSCLHVIVISDTTDAVGSYELTTVGLREQAKQVSVRKLANSVLKICWPSDLVGHVLQQNEALQVEGWTDVEVSTTDSGLNVEGLVPMQPGVNRFFRLRPPAAP